MYRHAHIHSNNTTIRTACMSYTDTLTVLPLHKQSVHVRHIHTLHSSTHTQNILCVSKTCTQSTSCACKCKHRLHHQHNHTNKTKSRANFNRPSLPQRDPVVQMPISRYFNLNPAGNILIDSPPFMSHVIMSVYKCMCVCIHTY